MPDPTPDTDDGHGPRVCAVLTTPLLAGVDRARGELGLSRSAYIRSVVAQALRTAGLWSPDLEHGESVSQGVGNAR